MAACEGCGRDITKENNWVCVNCKLEFCGNCIESDPKSNEFFRAGHCHQCGGSTLNACFDKMAFAKSRNVTFVDGFEGETDAPPERSVETRSKPEQEVCEE